jgi:cysteinyl-tRNA synthetase
LSTNADVSLHQRNGKAIANSRQPSLSSEAILKTLKAGVYYIKVYQRRGRTRYTLTLAAVTNAQLPTSGGGLPTYPPNPGTIPGSGSTQGHTLRGDRWLYQLQTAAIADINATPFNIITIDYSRDGSDAGRYTPVELQTLHNSSKEVLAYLSIGEAEDYRYYFNPSWIARDSVTGLNQPNPTQAPVWLDRTNPDWEGNYKVQYWSEDWQTIVLSYLDKVIDAGFDGVYLDIVDGFQYWSDPNQLRQAGSQKPTLTESDAANRMIQFVEKIAYYARVLRGNSNFAIIPQNAESILAYDLDGSYLNTISGIGVEDLFYDALTPQPVQSTQYRLQWLNQIKTANKPVLVVDYVDDGSGYTGANQTRINNFLNQARSNGYLPYVGLSNRALDTINPVSLWA